ncbi:MAG TPA: serine/threonine protein phosphatase [Rhodospirillaceae bacterium]|nr:MAG: hypothetical protein A2018_07495 [Alphaproteobacteria bacterium GWF2_58_20]HAU28707.1 serine/threonine protein phosphatase [Rhodospirillaceae bacterium]
MRIYAVGDIHGRMDLLEILHRKILDDLADHPHVEPRLIYLGDYVDRGLESRKVLDTLINAPLPGFAIDHIKGNHEAALLDFLKDSRACAGWLAIGGQATLYSYGVPAPQGVASSAALAEIQRKFLEALPLQHVAFMEKLKLSVSYGDFFFTHAGVRPNIPLEAQDERDLLWIREEFLRSNQAFSKVVVHGHTVSSEPEFHVNRIGLDTGAFATGILSCLVLDGGQMRLLQTP